MGCHTWYSVPVVTTKEEILKIAQEQVNEWAKEPWFSESDRKWYQYAIDAELIGPVCDMCTEYKTEESGKWILYMDITDFSLLQYNKANGTSYKSEHDVPEEEDEFLERYPDNPRIGGYPDNIIRNFAEFMEFYTKGFVDKEGEQHNFYWNIKQQKGEEDQRAKILKEIEQFFEKYPQGIITFG